MNKWGKRMMGIAELVATWSKDSNRSVGAVLTTYDNRILSTGYNGLPSNIDKVENVGDCMIHAEINALIRAPFDRDPKKMYITSHPCSQCAVAMIQARVTHVITYPPEPESHWYNSMLDAVVMLKEAGATITYL